MFGLELRIGSFALLAGACARVPADIAPAEPRPEADRAPGQVATTLPEIRSECVDEELAACVGACSDAECLEWCGGEQCLSAVEDVWGCMDEVEQRFASEHPRPPLEFPPSTTPDEYAGPTEASLEREVEWQDLYDRTIDARWVDACSSRCVAAVHDDLREHPGFCVGWRESYASWHRVTQPPPEQNEMWGVMSNAGLLGAMMIGTTLSVHGELGPSDDPRVIAMQSLVQQAGWGIGDVATCVPDLDTQGREFVLGVRLGGQDKLIVAPPADGHDLECVAAHVAEALTIPVRVARSFPEFEVRVFVQPPLHGWSTGLDGGFEDAFGGIGYGTSEAIGADGWGAGGGGSGDGGGGMGTIGGTIGPLEPPPPEPSEDTGG